MKTLPVPPLQHTLDGYLAAVSPVSTAEELEATKKAVAEYAAEVGPKSQEYLETFAAERDEAGSSWLADAWLESYLSVREPVTLTTSAAFLVNWPGDDTGLARAADFVHRISAVHLAYLRGELPTEMTGRGEEVDPSQRAYLGGGIRRPAPDVDVIERVDEGASDREMVVLWRGVPYAIPVSDGAGAVLSRQALQTALTALIVNETVRGDFAPVSYLGSSDLAGLLPRLLEAGENRASYDRLLSALFVVNLTNDEETQDEFMTRSLCGLGQGWAYKTVNYQVNYASDLIAILLEHSTCDGATLKDVVANAQQITADDSQAEAPEVEQLPWQVPSDLQVAIDEKVADYVERANQLRLRTVEFDLTIPKLPFKVSADAIQQAVILYAQLATFGQLRSAYEAVDMREYQAGRTECLRPNSAAAVELVRAVLAGQATGDQLQTALAEHKRWVIACKQGQGVDRHLFGLKLMAQRHGLTPTLQQEAGYSRLTTDFLSTSSLGGQEQLIRFGFAPTSVGGIGINYGTTAAGVEFFISYLEDEHGGDIDGFVANLRDGVVRFQQFLNQLAN